MKKISVVVPMYYEEEMVGACYQELKKVLTGINNYDYEMIFINDGSLDKTLPLLTKIAGRDKKVKIISFSRNFGHQAAVSAGLKYVTGDVIVIIDADLQDPPKVIPDMLKLWEKGYEVIYGKRKLRKGESFFKLFTAKMYYKILNRLSSVNIPKDTGDFRLVDRKVVDVINSLPEHNLFLRGLFSFVGFKQIEFLYERDKRQAGETKYTLKKMLRLSSDGIIGFSDKPLSFLFTISAIFFIIAIITLILLFVYPKHYLTFLMICLLNFNTSIIIFCLWILSLYIRRINDEVRNRPLYIIDKTINIKES